MTIVEKAKLANKVIKAQKYATQITLPTVVKMGVESASSDKTKIQEIAYNIAPVVDQIQVKSWTDGMTTDPGDMVYDPDKNYVYIFSGQTSMTHSNPLFYPGAQGVYYWQIIPKTKDFIKIYPDISGIIVSVKHDEIWYDTEAQNQYKWRGADNPNCVWPPVEGNEWELIPEEPENP